MPWAAAAAVIGGGIMSSIGSKKADKAQKKGLKKAAEESKKAMAAIDKEATSAYGEQKGLVQPWYDAGKEALVELSAGIKSGVYDPGQFHFDYAAFEKDPGYKFRVEQGERSMERGAAARGKLLSGQQQKALLGYGQDMGSQEYGNTFNRAAQEWGMNASRLQNNYNMLFSASTRMELQTSYRAEIHIESNEFIFFKPYFVFHVLTSQQFLCTQSLQFYHVYCYFPPNA